MLLLSAVENMSETGIGSPVLQLRQWLLPLCYLPARASFFSCSGVLPLVCMEYRNTNQYVITSYLSRRVDNDETKINYAP